MKRYFLLITIFCIGLAGCQSALTVKPVVVTTDVIAYEGTEKNNGILWQDAAGIVITPAKRKYYNALIEIYGAAKWKETGLPCFVPALTKDFGITPAGANYHLSNGALQNFALMVSWYKSGRAPK